MQRPLSLLLAFLAAPLLASAQTRSPETLRLDAIIPLRDVAGRIDHLALDLQGQRLFIAALGNNSLVVLDLKTGQRLRTITDLPDPQGVAFVPSTNRLFVANGHDGSVRQFDASTWRLLQILPLGDDADNLRFDPTDNHVFVGHGQGSLSELNPHGATVASVPLGAHPESFQLERTGPRIFVNVPALHTVAVIDRISHTVIASWPLGELQANFPMALDDDDHRLFIVTRQPARMVVFDTDTGRQILTLPSVEDCDDIFYDQRHHRLYAIGGEGAIAVIAQHDPDHYEEVERLKTAPGARTGLFSPELNRLFVAVRRHGSEPAEIRVYRVPR
ncbi:MAG TPA: hypothetical protein VM865_09525 [Acidobacteriaceae bacterium]|nr:hypothetical protein [Acidobacteriaceae bacterium]